MIHNDPNIETINVRLIIIYLKQKKLSITTESSITYNSRPSSTFINQHQPSKASLWDASAVTFLRPPYVI